jgi:hypothetical protein
MDPRAAGRRTHRTLVFLSLLPVVLLLPSALITATATAAGHEAGRTIAKPGSPVAKAPKGAIATARPTFRWSNARGAAKYEVRVYQGARRLVRTTGIKRTSWACGKALPENVGLTWKVRARNARGAGAWSRSVKFRILPAGSAKAITAFGFATPAATGTIADADHAIALTVPFGTDVTALVATFTTTGVSVKVGATPQVSGRTPNDFSNPVTYTVTAADGTTQDYVVTVTVSLSPAKAITRFEFRGLYPVVAGVVDDATYAVAVEVPFDTDLHYLSATFTTTGVSVTVEGTPQVSGFTENDFTSPVTYTVTAADGTTQEYVVTVTVAAPSQSKEITNYSFQGLTPAVNGEITEPSHSIALTVPFGTDVTALVATFSTTGVSVKVGATPQVSGATPNDFTSPVTYTVTAADTSTQTYAVTVTVDAAAIGQDYGGGKIAYILQSGDPGYDPGQTHGLVAAKADQSAGIVWSNVTSTAVGTTGTALGTGQANTTAIVGQPGCTGGAAYLCDHLEAGGRSDWYLPSLDELSKLYLNRAVIGGFADADWSDGYWSSSEYDADEAWRQGFFGVGTPVRGAKANDFISARVRAVRSF